MDGRLSFHEPKVVNGVCVVEPPNEVFELGVKEWSNALVGYFVGKRIPFKIVKEHLEKKWRKWGGVNVITGDNESFLFKFDNSAARDLVISNTPWEVWGTYLALRQWEEGMSLRKDSFSSIPVWVKLSNVPFELWTKPGISYVASAIGVPLCMNAATTTSNRLSFARVCIEMKASSSFPTSYKVRRRNGTLIDVMVQYAWKPSACSVCKVFDHSSKQCHLVAKKDLTSRQGGIGLHGVPAMLGGPTPESQGADVSKRQGVDYVATPCEDIPLAPEEVCASLVGAVVGNASQEDGATKNLGVGDLENALGIETPQEEDGVNIPQAVAVAGPIEPFEVRVHPTSFCPVQDGCNLQVGKGKDPITPLKQVPEAVLLSPDTASLDPNIMIRNFVGSGKRRKKKRDSSRKKEEGLTTP
ncbi:DUF4283 domain-containing protein [Cephalotus follicularis]|uniref:DUF4283 domain-containing protein n=1 Tax=Cephalotus follicularis TaxID=3775 RepID=A0A1Q3D5U4_CEPFO|nr:DUF4283 domain-containing protein [Cephalotus follicularis]